MYVRHNSAHLKRLETNFSPQYTIL